MLKNSVLFMSAIVVGLGLVSTADAIKTQQKLDTYFGIKNTSLNTKAIKAPIYKKYKAKKAIQSP